MVKELTGPCVHEEHRMEQVLATLLLSLACLFFSLR